MGCQLVHHCDAKAAIQRNTKTAGLPLKSVCNGATSSFDRCGAVLIFS
jgi:hypothetical protein